MLILINNDFDIINSNIMISFCNCFEFALMNHALNSILSIFFPHYIDDTTFYINKYSYLINFNEFRPRKIVTLINLHKKKKFFLLEIIYNIHVYYIHYFVWHK